MARKAAPEPHVEHARQFFTPTGTEVFFSEAYGRRPDVVDALRAMGWGATRLVAETEARENWKKAWRSLAAKSSVA
jgi:hypothetical protein